MAQRLRLHAFNAWSTGLIPGQENKIPHAHGSAKKKKKRERERERQKENQKEAGLLHVEGEADLLHLMIKQRTLRSSKILKSNLP